jgi:hypothetical protein
VSASRRRLAAVGVCLALVAAIAGWWWQHGSNERHVRTLVVTGYRYSGYGDQTPRLAGYGRDHYGPELCGDRDDWVGFTSLLVIGGRADRQLGAERAAVKFAAEGWHVDRWLGRGTVGREPRFVFATRGVDRITLAYDRTSVSVGATSGPCGGQLSRFSPPANEGFHLVDHFED